MTATVTRTELEHLLATDAATLVDALPQSYYTQMHLPGAINLVESEVDELAVTLLPHRDRTIVTYCSNPSCQNSKAVARRLEALGYTDVRTYPAGIQDWVEAGNATETATVSTR